MMTTREIIATIYANPCSLMDRSQQTSVYVFGSSFERTTTTDLDADIDFVIVDESLPVVTNVSESQQFEYCLLLIQDHRTPPGYAKLQWVHYDVPQTRSQFNILRSGYRVDTENRLVWCLPEESVLHGPALKTESSVLVASQDLVPAVRCKVWPACASEWLTRTRLYNYPTQDQINKCKDLGFFLVYVGHPNSQEKEYRFHCKKGCWSLTLMLCS